ncbi:MAG: prolyl oligopeptidase family serine peptidase [Gammaproteobacteria bacterium]
MIRNSLLLLVTALLLAGAVAADDDPFQWLEAVESETALDWARAQNRRSEGVLRKHPLFAPIHERNLQILRSEDRIALPEIRAGAIHNFWRDADHVRGLWRTTSVESFRGERPEWEVILDIDRLAAEEKQNWVWGGSACRRPEYDRCLVSLSVGGADAAARREFDLGTGEFVEEGFSLPESKSQLSWRDRDSVFLGPALTDEQVTDSGYPRSVRLWRRGTPRDEAELLFEGERGDVAVSGYRLWDGEDYYDLVVRAPGFFTRHYYLYRGGEVHRLNLPDDALVSGVLDGQLLLRLKSDWTVDERTYPQGALVAGPVGELLGEAPRMDIVFRPGPRSSIESVTTTKNTVLVNVLDNVVSRLLRFTRVADGWHGVELDVPPMGSVSVISADDRSDRFYFDHKSFLSPASLYEADAASGKSSRVASEPEWFDTEGMTVEQFHAVSADGERIPYFVVKPAGFEANGTHPTLLYGYGGFEVSRTPAYSGVIGSAWLARGGVYVLANIRGGGEFGPGWHHAALLENRQRAFDDFIAVAEDLVERKITSPRHLGIWGGSNGGLLVGAVMVQRPDLFNAVVSQVPLLDMRRYHRLLAGASWMAEYGDPDDPEQWAWIGRYSPYQNVSAAADYPLVFFTTSTRDDRVHPGHARKMAAKMIDQGHQVLYYENIEGGHGGAANLEQSAYINALIFSYLHARLGAETPAEASD